MFDLEKSITEWRRQMIAGGVKTPVPLEELEGHLREEVARQLCEGLSEEQAFELAVGGIGPASLLKMEFKKVNHADKTQRQRRMAGFIFAFILGFYALGMASVITKNNLTANERLLGFASVATTLLAVWAAWNIMPRFFPVLASKRGKSVMGLCGGISGMIWFLAFAWLVLPRFNFTPGQLVVAVSWAIVPTITLPTVAFLVLDKNEHQEFLATNP
jgi:hypothetical protein